MSTWVNFVVVQALVSCFVLYCTMIRLEHPCLGALCINQPITHGLHSLSFSYTRACQHSPCWETVSAATVLCVWACPNDWQVNSSSCKSGSGTRVEPLHLSCWIHICTVHNTNYNSPCVHISVCACVWSTLNTSALLLLIILNFSTKTQTVANICSCVQARSVFASQSITCMRILRAKMIFVVCSLGVLYCRRFNNFKAWKEHKQAVEPWQHIWCSALDRIVPNQWLATVSLVC